MSRFSSDASDKKKARERLIFGLSTLFCVLLVVLAVYFSIDRFHDKRAENIAQIQSEQSSEVPIVNQPSTSSSSQSQSQSEPEPQPEPEPKPTPEPEPVIYMTPLAGALGLEYSADALVFSETMDDWRAHAGVDFLAQVGDVVCSIGDGMVTDFYYDELTGHTMEITHPDGCISVYCGLGETVFAETGQTVAVGDAIGTVGDDLPFESADEPHLHLEVIQNGRRIDPLSIIG